MKGPLLLGILNITPDSFSDGGAYFLPDQALAQAHKLIAGGADILDLGAESTRPGAKRIDAETEWARLEPVLEGLKNTGYSISLDTSKAEILRRAFPYRISYLNDVSGLSDPALPSLLADQPKIKIILNHHRGIPASITNTAPNLLLEEELIDYFQAKIKFLSAAGITQDRLILDPGFGFGKGLEENLRLFGCLPALKSAFRLPLLVGISRKRFVRDLWGVNYIDSGSTVLGQIALSQGATMVRCHDPSCFKPLRAVWPYL